MVVMRKVVCDLCGAEVLDRCNCYEDRKVVVTHYRKVERFSDSHRLATIDLCDKCSASLVSGKLKVSIEVKMGES
jgi:hypothetical protein